MKNKPNKSPKAVTIQPAASIEKEQIGKVEEALDRFVKSDSDLARFQSLLSTVKADVNQFVETGDLDDDKALSEVAATLAKEAIIERRLAHIGKNADDEVESNLHRESEALKRLVLGALGALRRAAVERAARAMKPHFEDFQECRRKAQRSVEATKVAPRIHEVENLSLNLNEPELSRKYLEIARQVFPEVERASKELGGIPSEHELMAL